MGNSILNIGVTALTTAQAGLTTVGHNIANVNTPGFSRQVVVQATNTALRAGAGYLGQGTHIARIERLYNQFLAQQLLSAEAAAAEMTAHYERIQQVDNLLADTAAGLTPALSGYFAALHDLATHPGSVAARQAVLSSGEALVARFHMLDFRLEEMRTAANRQVEASVAAINGYARQIAALNERIALAESGNGSTPPNDLLDQRDALVAELNREIQVTVVRQGDAYNVFIGNGQPLVTGSTPGRLSAVPDPQDPTRTAVALASGSGDVVLKEELLGGGRLGGELAFRRETLEPARNELGRIALVLAATMNDQHRLGQDLHGALGGDLFTMAGPLVTAHGGNGGNALLTAVIDDASALTASDYRLSYDDAGYTLTRLSDGSVTTFAAFPQTVDGFTLTLASGAVAPGDSFLIQPAVNGARDLRLAITEPSRLAAAAPIATAAAGGNIGSGAISAGEVVGPPPPDPNLQAPVTIEFNDPPTSFKVTGTGTGDPASVPYTPGGPISYNGWTVTITGTPAAGDRFTIGPNTGGVSDGRNAVKLAALATAGTVSSGTASYQGAYAALVGRIGNITRELEVTSTAQSNLARQASEALAAVAGVNLDEEAAALLRYQQAYQAAGKVMQIASRLFDTLLELGR